MAKATAKVVLQKLHGADTANVRHSESFHIYGHGFDTVITNHNFTCSVCTKSGHLSFIDLTKLIMPTAPLLLLARLQDKDDHMISIAASHDLRVINQSQAGEWLQIFQNHFHKL